MFMRMGSLTRRWRGAPTCSMTLTTVSITVLMVSMGIITVQARSQLKDDEIEAYLNRVNKPAVKSMVLEDGDIIDCVDIYKQPAFDHPLLKDYKIITPPSHSPWMHDLVNSSRHQPNLQQLSPNGYEECPKGTVPIRRTLKSDLLRRKSLDGYGRRDDVPVYEMVERAGLIQHGGYVGVTGCLNVWSVSVENNEWSHTAVEATDGTQKNFIEGGWLVNPELYGDNRTRLYAYWTADGYGNTGCYNMLCEGFIQLSTKVVLGAAVERVSVHDGDQYEILIIFVKDEPMNVWWLVIEWEYVGFWPINIFAHYRFDQVTTVKWIGSVLNRKNGGRHTTTQMGSGRLAEEGYLKAAFMRNTQVMKDHKEGFDFPDPSSYLVFADSPKCYSVKFEDYADVVYFGGPGLGAEGC